MFQNNEHTMKTGGSIEDDRKTDRAMDLNSKSDFYTKRIMKEKLKA